MPLGIVSTKDFESALKDSTLPDNVVNESKSGQIIDIPIKGRNTGDVNVPESLRKIIGETSAIDGRAAALTIAKSFGISNSSASAYANGATSTDSYNKPDAKLSEHIFNAKMKVTKRAMSKLLKSMHHITDEKLADASVTELSSVAKNMSSIVKEMNPSDDNESKVNPVQFIVMAPQILNENHFETIYSKE